MTRTARSPSARTDPVAETFRSRSSSGWGAGRCPRGSSRRHPRPRAPAGHRSFAGHHARRPGLRPSPVSPSFLRPLPGGARRLAFPPRCSLHPGGRGQRLFRRSRRRSVADILCIRCRCTTPARPTLLRSPARPSGFHDALVDQLDGRYMIAVSGRPAQQRHQPGLTQTHDGSAAAVGCVLSCARAARPCCSASRSLSLQITDADLPRRWGARFRGRGRRYRLTGGYLEPR